MTPEQVAEEIFDRYRDLPPEQIVEELEMVLFFLGHRLDMTVLELTGNE